MSETSTPAGRVTPEADTSLLCPIQLPLPRGPLRERCCLSVFSAQKKVSKPSTAPTSLLYPLHIRTPFPSPGRRPQIPSSSASFLLYIAGRACFSFVLSFPSLSDLYPCSTSAEKWTSVDRSEGSFIVSPRLCGRNPQRSPARSTNTTRSVSAIDRKR